MQDNSDVGILRFVLVSGILMFGIPVALITAVFRFLLGNEPLQEFIYSERTWLAIIVQTLVGGVLFGLVVWILRRRATTSMK